MKTLFDSTKIKGMELKNRFVRSATLEGMADSRGFPTKDLFKLYERLAKGRVGLIITGITSVSPDGNVSIPGLLQINRDDHIPIYRKLVKHVHYHGARIAMQIAHAGSGTTETAIGSQPIAPSSVNNKILFVTPREMTEEDIERVLNAFAQAARRVKESGFDALQFHGAHGYLISEFLSPTYNRRKDKWGGSVENRMRFVRELYKRCREKVGKDFPILIKMNGYDNMKSGLKLEEGVVMAKMMEDMGFDGIEISCGVFGDQCSSVRGDLPMDIVVDEYEMYMKKNWLFRAVMRRFGEKIIRPLPFQQVYNLNAAREIKKRVSIPVFAVGGMTDPAVMKEAVANGDADYLSLSRALIIDPLFPRKIQEGSLKPSPCKHCNQCLYALVSEPLRCHYGNRAGKKEMYRVRSYPGQIDAHVSGVSANYNYN